ncbi:MAG: carbamoyltransferase N-terminal domain-containing protein [Gammaproteobacteria bacterium]
MIILGFQFGHDGTVCVIRDGNILAGINRERQNRVKHALGVTTHELDMALAHAGIDITDADCCTIVSTQGVEIFTGLIESFDVTSPAPHASPAPCPLYNLI